MRVYHNCMHINADKIRHLQILSAISTCYILGDSAQGMPYRWLSREVALGQYTCEENPIMLKNAVDTTIFCYTDMQHDMPKVGST